MTPHVLCVMLAAGRQKMVERAIRSFHSQTYSEKALYILDTGDEKLKLEPSVGVIHAYLPGPQRPIGTLRNLANALSLTASLDSQIIAHWDSDDWSHPRRLTDQVALLETSNKPAVGYRDVLFWDEHREVLMNQAWLYCNPNPTYVIGSSLMYWRQVWCKYTFPDKHEGEDTQWIMRVKCASDSAVLTLARQAMMICSIHGGNTCSRITPGAKEWRRVPRWDEYAREVMQL